MQDIYKIQSTVDDPDVDSLTISVALKEGKTSADVSSFVIERAVLKWAALHIPGWVDYCVSNGMKHL